MNFVFDLDGTLCFDGMTLDAGIQQALLSAHRHGHRLIFASARSYRDTIDLLGPELSQETVIGLNGGLVYQAGQLIFERHLDAKSFQDALSWCRQYHLPYFVDDDFNYSTQYKAEIPFISSVDPLGLAQEIPISQLTHPIKMVIYMGHHEDLVADMVGDLASLGNLDVSYHELEKCLYINPHATDKATTMATLFGTDYVAFGNDKNDISLFQQALYSVQVGQYGPLSPYADEQIPADSVQVTQAIKGLFKTF